MRRLIAPLCMLALALSACGDRSDRERAKGFDPATDAVQSSTPADTAVMPTDAPPQEEEGPQVTPTPAADSPLDEAACASSIGARAAARLVERCIAVSPATHPPCNAENPCALIRDEIDRACAQYGPGEPKPAECSA